MSTAFTDPFWGLTVFPSETRGVDDLERQVAADGPDTLRSDDGSARAASTFPGTRRTTLYARVGVCIIVCQ